MMIKAAPNDGGSSSTRQQPSKLEWQFVGKDSGEIEFRSLVNGKPPKSGSVLKVDDMPFTPRTDGAVAFEDKLAKAVLDATRVLCQSVTKTRRDLHERRCVGDLDGLAKLDQNLKERRNKLMTSMSGISLSLLGRLDRWRNTIDPNQTSVSSGVSKEEFIEHQIKLVECERVHATLRLNNFLLNNFLRARLLEADDHSENNLQPLEADKLLQMTDLVTQIATATEQRNSFIASKDDILDEEWTQHVASSGQSLKAWALEYKVGGHVSLKKPGGRKAFMMRHDFGRGSSSVLSNYSWYNAWDDVDAHLSTESLVDPGKPTFTNTFAKIDQGYLALKNLHDSMEAKRYIAALPRQVEHMISMLGSDDAHCDTEYLILTAMTLKEYIGVEKAFHKFVKSAWESLEEIIDQEVQELKSKLRSSVADMKFDNGNPQDVSLSDLMTGWVAVIEHTAHSKKLNAKKDYFKLLAESGDQAERQKVYEEEAQSSETQAEKSKAEAKKARKGLKQVAQAFKMSNMPETVEELVKKIEGIRAAFPAQQDSLVQKESDVTKSLVGEGHRRPFLWDEEYYERNTARARSRVGEDAAETDDAPVES